MSIRFCDVKISDAARFFVSVRLDGHPDEEDLRKNTYLWQQARQLKGILQVEVQHYTFMTSSNEEDANCDHIALMNVIDELADMCNDLNGFLGVGEFTTLDSVEHGDYFSFELVGE